MDALPLTMMMIQKRTDFVTQYRWLLLISTGIQSDKQSQPLIQYEKSRKSCPETSRAYCHLAQAKGCLKEVMSHDERWGINLRICMADVVYLIQKQSRSIANVT